MTHFSRVKAGTAVRSSPSRRWRDWQINPMTFAPVCLNAVGAGAAGNRTGGDSNESPDKGAFNAVSTTAVQRFGLLVSQALRMTRVREDELQSALVRLSSQAERDQTDFVLAAVDPW